MKNGPYEMVVAPKEYPGRKYRSRYVYEHHLVWWQRTGEVVPDGCLIHHKDENKRNNKFRNLELKSISDHSKDHAKSRIRRQKLKCSSCGSKFEMAASDYRYKYKVGQRNFYCSRACSYIKF